MPFEDEIMTRLAQRCTNIKHLELANMFSLSKAGRMQLCGLFRQIIQQNPPLEVLSFEGHIKNNDRNEDIGEFILETILSSTIKSIKDLDLSGNSSWF